MMVFTSVDLFPAYAGVILAAAPKMYESLAFPRIRRGDPKTGKFLVNSKLFSPHTQG